MRWRDGVAITAVAVTVGLATGIYFALRMPRSPAVPRPVPSGDVEVAWLHNPTAYEAWDRFVWGVKRIEGGGLSVDLAAAYPELTTRVPEVVVRRAGVAGAVRFRWYKVTDEATQEDWVAALARRDPPPLAVVAGWSSDRAKSLAEALRDAPWPDGRRPLYFLMQATADQILPAGTESQAAPLISIYDRSFRVCFTNRQMARAVTDFVLSDPSLTPGPILPPGLRAAGRPPVGPASWHGVVAGVAEWFLRPSTVPGFVIEWQDDPYSQDLGYRFREEFWECAVARGLPVPEPVLFPVPFSTGRANRANPAEAWAAAEVVARLPPGDTRGLLVLPTVTAPARRTLGAIVQGNPGIGRRLVAVTGDGLGVNTFVRDREFAWPLRLLPIPFVLFTHDHPFRWDPPQADPPPPPGYELHEPPPGAPYTSSEDVQLYQRLARLVAAAVLPEDSSELVREPDEAARRLRQLDPPFFDAAGNRRDDTGEHVVLIRPVFPGDQPDVPGPVGAVLEVFTRSDATRSWHRIFRLPLTP